MKSAEPGVYNYRVEYLENNFFSPYLPLFHLILPPKAFRAHTFQNFPLEGLLIGSLLLNLIQWKLRERDYKEYCMNFYE